MENQNSVAYVGKIGSVSEIPGADNIELVTVGGWNAITKKGEYKDEDVWSALRYTQMASPNPQIWVYSKILIQTIS